MPSRQEPKSPSSGADIFREQAIEAWKRQDAESRALLDLSPRWMRWALAGIFALAAAGLLVAANTTIASRVLGPAVVLPSTTGDSLIVEALLPAHTLNRISIGQKISFRSTDPNEGAITLRVLSATTLPTLSDGVVDRSTAAASAQGETNPSVLVLGGALVSTLRTRSEPASPSPGSRGTAQLVIGQESLLHLLRPRTPKPRTGPT